MDNELKIIQRMLFSHSGELFPNRQERGCFVKSLILVALMVLVLTVGFLYVGLLL